MEEEVNSANSEEPEEEENEKEVNSANSERTTEKEEAEEEEKEDEVNSATWPGTILDLFHVTNPRCFWGRAALLQRSQKLQLLVLGPRNVPTTDLVPDPRNRRPH